ncbi:MAG: hypothetical protein AAF334_10415 [Pseudomonadota bacterium]
MTDLHDMAANVTGPENFAVFIATLRKTIRYNAEHSGPFESENYDLDGVLEAMQGWSTTQIDRDELGQMSPWAAVAHMLVVGHYYE